VTIHTKRAFKYRFYPTDAQADQLSRTFGCVRKVYNLALEARTEAWTTRHERLDYHTTSALLTAWKQTEQLAFLNQVSAVPLQQTLRHLHKAFVSLLCEDPGIRPLRKGTKAVGIDVGLNHLLTLSTGEKLANPRHESRDRARLGSCATTKRS
jgi:transposase